ncbi:cytosine permease [Paraburkholderia sp. MM5384-R2]|uniref:purine-cytosine permease family protein n=1 Tax=Paraburkholderia sp. MM5384-R2 TaxID=2723097 RepID=UPI0016113BE0|nr:cytosine permease [Paraburkholderia sp. MM5384-R2]MBB5501243.1 NCS1 nucleoside transporter family [Paraburkholderia sp. MM5384-R2]
MQQTTSPISRARPKARLTVERRSIDYVPLSERHGKVWHLGPIWFSGNAQIATLAVGAIGSAMGANLLCTALAVVLGSALGSFFMAFHSTQGPQLGLPQMIQSRPQFGYMGALLVWVVAFITYVGYNAFNQVLAGDTVHHLIHAGAKGSLVIFTVLALTVAFLGHDLIHKAQQWLAAAMIVVLTVFCAGLIFCVHFDASQFSLSGFRTIPFFAQLFAAAAYQLSWSIYVSDYSRYLPANVGVRASFWWTYLGAFIGGTWMMLVGTAAAAMYGKLDISAAVQVVGDSIYPGLGTVTLVLSLATLLTMTSLNFYGASLTLLSIADSFRPSRPTTTTRFVSLAIVAVSATLIALGASGDFMAKFGDFLGILLYLFTPWTAINLVDFYLVRKTTYSVREIFNSNGMYGRWNWRGLTAYFVGFTAMIPFFSNGIYTGPVARLLGGTDVGMIVGLVVSAGIYYWTCQSLDMESERIRAHAADIGLDAY